MSIKYEHLINAAYRLHTGNSKLKEDSFNRVSNGAFGDAFITDDRLVKVTSSFTEALMASIAARLPAERLPDFGEVFEITETNGSKLWLIEQELLSIEHELIDKAGMLLTTMPELSLLDTFNYNFREPGNEWVFESGLDRADIVKIIQDLQQSMLAFEMTGFLHTDLKVENLGVKDVDGIETLVCIAPCNHHLEQTYTKLNASITDLGSSNQEVIKFTMEECIKNDYEHDMVVYPKIEREIDDNLMPTTPITM